MRYGSFRFAVGVGAALAVAAVGVSVLYDLPLRDPDGAQTATYVRLPLILLGAFLVDVVPPTLRRRHPGVPLGVRFVAVVRERWPWEQVRFALVGLAAWYATYVAFRNLKSAVPFVNPRLWDAELAGIDRALFLGRDPAAVLQDLFGTDAAAQVFSTVYLAWIVLLPVSLVVALVWSRDRRAGEWYVTAVAVDWVLGVATYFAVPSLGPVYSNPSQFAQLAPTWTTEVQQAMIEDRYAVLAGPWDTSSVQTIAAFASLHVAVSVTACVFAELVRLPRWLRTSLWVFLVLTVLSTVYLGWHFFVDTLGGAVIGVAGVAIAAWGTGNHVRGRLTRVGRQPAVAVASVDSRV